MQTDGTVRIFDGTTPLSTVDIGGRSGPRDLVNNASFKAGTRYFPKSTGPYNMILNDKCYLYVIDSKGVVVWESMYDNVTKRDKYVNNAYTGLSPDPSEWPANDGMAYTASPTSRPTTSTAKPTTFKPSTKKPTARPSLAPTTKKPTSIPSLAPTTRKPTKKPTTTKEPVVVLCKGDGSSGCTANPTATTTEPVVLCKGDGSSGCTNKPTTTTTTTTRLKTRPTNKSTVRLV